MRQSQDTSNVDASLAVLRLQLARPSGVFDPYTTLAALEHLVDLARDKKDARATRLNVVLRQARPLVSHPSFQQMLLKLVGSKEEIEVAKEIQKALKHPSLRAPAQRPFPYPAGPSRRRPGPTCYNCGKRGHIARTCFSRPSGNQTPKQ